MESKQKYTEEFNLSDDFLDSIDEMPMITAIKIADQLEDVIITIPINDRVSTVLGGIIIDGKNEPITYAIEIIKTQSEPVIFSDISLISMDDYLDLMNMNLTIELNGNENNNTTENTDA